MLLSLERKLITMNNNYCIILAGGVGRRLWPCSRKKLPKQFLDIFGVGRTLLQQTYDRFEKIIPKENIFISTYKDYVELVAEQLPEVTADHIMLEPVQLSTAPAVAWASFEVALTNPRANFIVSPVDQCILNEEAFAQDIRDGLAFAQSHNAILALGVQPTTPNTGYGYIQMGEACEGGKFWHVKSFTEKPDLQFAEMFVESGEFVWNTGLFIYSASTVMVHHNKLLPNISQKMTGHDFAGTDKEEKRKFFEEFYPASLRQSIDLVLLERCENVVVQKCHFGWADVGSWTQLHEMSHKDADGNTVAGGANVMFVGSANNYVRLPKGTMAAIQDLEGYLVVQDGDVLVICPNDDTSRIRRLVAEAQMKLGNEAI